MDEYSHATTASIRNLSSSGVHGVNLGGVMVGRMEEEELEEKEEEGGDGEGIEWKGGRNQ